MSGKRKFGGGGTFASNEERVPVLQKAKRGQVKKFLYERFFDVLVLVHG
jgi:hypothetical protein